MFGKKRISDKIDYGNLNELIRLGKDFLKIIFGVSIVALIVLVTYIGKEWKIIPLIRDIFSILSPFFIGIILAWILDPIVGALTKKGVKRGIACTFVYVIIIAVIVIFGNIVAPSLIDQINDIITMAPQMIKDYGEQLDSFIVDMSNNYNLNVNDVKDSFNEILNNLLYSITVDGPSMIVSVIKSIVSGGFNFIIGFLIGFYMLLDFDGVRRHLSKIVPIKHREEIGELTDKLNSMLRNYVYGTLIVMFILFIFQSIGMSIAGMKAPLVFGLFCAVMNIIPYLGPYIGGIPSVIVAFTISPKVGLGVLISVLICQGIESYFITPTVMSKTMKLHPVTIILGLLLFGHFFGILGMLFATPVISCGKVILNFVVTKYDLFGSMNNQNKIDNN